MEIGDNYKTFENRQEAAEVLVPLLLDLKDSNPLIMAIPRGAVPMAQLVAEALDAQMDLALVKKIGHPMQPEFAIGAVSETGEILLSSHAQEVDPDYIEKVALRLVESLQRQRSQYLGFERFHYPQGRTVVLIDDGIATGLTMAAAVRSLKAQGAKRIIVAAPVASHEAQEKLKTEGAELRIYYTPKYFGSVSYFYKNFDQVSDAEVGSYFQVRSHEIEIQTSKNSLTLKGILGRPMAPLGFVVFAHGSGSGRLSPRNQFLADIFNRQGIATLLADLLTDDEGHDRSKVFDIKLLSERLILLVEWVKKNPQFRDIPLGLLGASTGAGAALVAAAQIPEKIEALVSRGGRPDLATDSLEHVQCPVLLLVGELDYGVIELNEQAFQKIPSEKKLEIIPGATHLFEEPGTLDKVAEHALHWFDKCFSREKILNQNFEPPLYP